MLATSTSSTSSPSLKVKVIYGEGRLVIPCGDANDKVHRLINDINRRFQSYLGDATVRAKELTTSDGFLINPHDRIADVIDDGAVLRALDYNTWLDQNLPLLEKKWHEVGRADYALDRRPWRSVEIGLHKHRKLYVKISSVYKTIDRLELFDAESLTSFGKAGTVLIARKEVKQDGEDWFIEASFVVDASGVVTAVELQVKTTSDVRPQIERVGINHDLTIGKVQVIQSADPPKPDKTYTLPPAKRTGSSFTNVLSEHLSKPFEEGEVPENKATGDCGLDIAQKDVTQADSTWYRKDQEGFYNNFYNHLTIFNPAEKEIAIVKITSEIEKDGAWVPTEFRMGSKSGYYRYNMSSWDPAEGFTLASNDRLNLATESSVLIKAKQFDRARRAHRSLPQPVRIRLTFVNKEGGTSQIVLEQRNKLLEVPTVESREDLHKQKVVSFIYADDLETEARIFVDAILKEKDGYGNERLELSSVDSKGAYITKSTQRWALYQARKEGKSEVLLEEFSQESEEKGYSVKAYVLVDLEAQWAYALKVEINTNTSSTVDYIPLPLLSDD